MNTIDLSLPAYQVEILPALALMEDIRQHTDTLVDGALDIHKAYSVGLPWARDLPACVPLGHFFDISKHGNSDTALVVPSERADMATYFFAGEGVFHLVSSPLDEDAQENADGSTPFVYERVCDFFTVFGSGRDPETGDECLFLTHADPEGGPNKRLLVPRSVVAHGGSDLAKYLAAAGLTVSPKPKLRNALQALLTSIKGPRIVTASSLGWHAKSLAFVLPDRVIGAETDRRFHFPAKYAKGVKIATGGTIEQWHEKVLSLVKGNRMHTFALAAAFASPLMKFVPHMNSFLVNIQGRTTTGKSTALDVYGSVWGTGNTLGFAHTWKTTTNGLEGLAALHSGVAFSLDELRLAIEESGKGSILTKAYMLGSGSGKVTMTTRRSLNDIREWQLVGMSTGEHCLSDLAREQSNAGSDPEGVRARLIDVPIDEKNGHGAFDTVHHYVDDERVGGETSPGKLLADDLKRLTRRYYGNAGPEFVSEIFQRILSLGCTALGDNSDDADWKDVEIAGSIALGDQIKGDADEFVSSLGLAQDCSPLVGRVAANFALIYVAGTMAARFGVLGDEIKEADIREAVVFAFERWLSRQSSVTGTLSVSPALKLRDWLQSNVARFVSAEDAVTGRLPHNFAGYTKDGMFAILPSVFRKEVCAGSKDDEHVLLSWLSDRRLIVTSKGRTTYQLWISDNDRPRVVYIHGLVRNLDDTGHLTVEDSRAATGAVDELVDDTAADADSGVMQKKAVEPLSGGATVVKIGDVRKPKKRVMGKPAKTRI